MRWHLDLEKEVTTAPLLPPSQLFPDMDNLFVDKINQFIQSVVIVFRNCIRYIYN